MNRFAPALLAVLLVTGCSTARHTQPSAPTPPAVTYTPAAAPSDANSVRVAQCRKELDAIQAYDIPTYNKYKVRYDRVASQLSKYLEIKNNIGDDINDIALPKYQFAIRSTCFDIKNALTQLIIKES